MPKIFVISTDKDFGQSYAKSNDYQWFSSFLDAIIPLGEAATAGDPVKTIYLDTNFDDFDTVVVHAKRISESTEVVGLPIGVDTVKEIDPAELKLQYMQARVEKAKAASTSPIIVNADGLVNAWKAYLDSIQGRTVTVFVGLFVIISIFIVLGVAALVGVQVWDIIKSPSQRYELGVPGEKSDREAQP